MDYQFEQNVRRAFYACIYAGIRKVAFQNKYSSHIDDESITGALFSSMKVTITATQDMIHSPYEIAHQILLQIGGELINEVKYKSKHEVVFNISVKHTLVGNLEIQLQIIPFSELGFKESDTVECVRCKRIVNPNQVGAAIKCVKQLKESDCAFYKPKKAVLVFSEEQKETMDSEIERLRELQADHTRFFTQEEFERLQYLSKLKFELHGNQS